MLFLDACHTRGVSGIAVLSGSTGGEAAVEDPGERHGAFTGSIVEALTQPEDGSTAAADAEEARCPKGYVTLDNLATYVIDKVGSKQGFGFQTPRASFPRSMEDLILADFRTSPVIHGRT